MSITARIDVENLVFLSQVVRELKSMEIGIVCSAEELYGADRRAEFTFARALVSFYLRSRGFTLTRIGEYLNRNHATIINLLKYKRGRQAYDEKYHLARCIIDANNKNTLAYDALIEYHAKEIARLTNLKLVSPNGKE